MKNYLDNFKPEDIKAFEEAYLSTTGNDKKALKRDEFGYKNKPMHHLIYYFVVGLLMGKKEMTMIFKDDLKKIGGAND